MDIASSVSLEREGGERDGAVRVPGRGVAWRAFLSAWATFLASCVTLGSALVEKSRKQGPFGLCGVKWLAADCRPPVPTFSGWGSAELD